MFCTIRINLLCAKVNSSTIRDAARFCLYFHRKHRKHHQQHLISFVQDEQLSNRVWSTVFVTRQIVLVCSGISPSGVGMQIGQFSSLCESHSGPFFQMFGCRNSLGVWPREIGSAGLSAVGTWCQSDMLVLVCISATRFATNVFNICGEDLIHWSTMVLRPIYDPRNLDR